ncbi:uncharacterized protein LOC119072515 isoform X2 [Bradysia coprophila]|nr:uncharacterized protein LOC119072515 isoform X2 [Bradysia coprophila]
MMQNPQDSNLETSFEAQQPIASNVLNGYDEFMSWRKSWNINSLTEEVFIEFFREAAQTLPPELLRTLFFTLKNRMRSVHNVNLMEFASLNAFVQQKGSIGTKNTHGKAKKTGTRVTINFSNDEINKFLTEAPDSKYLAVKTATVIGTHTVCAFTDIRLIRMNMVNDFGSGIVVRIPQRRADRTRDNVTISGEYAAIVRKYLRLRLRAPIEIKTTKFFIHYRQGKCWPGAIGRKPIGKMAEEIARYLKLENPENYTTESFRMISPKMVNNGLHTDATERSSSTIPSCTITGSEATSFNVGMSNATNSVDYISLSSSDAEDYGLQYGLSGTNDAIDVDPDDKDSRAPSPRSNEKMSDADVSADIFNKSLTVTHRTVQSKIDEQAKQIVRLKQVVEDQSLEIKILKDLLADSMKRSIRDEMSR